MKIAVRVMLVWVSLVLVGCKTDSTVYVTIEGQGRIIEGDGSVLNCTDDCDAVYSHYVFAVDEHITLQAIPDPGFEFFGWAADCADQPTCRHPLQAWCVTGSTSHCETWQSNNIHAHGIFVPEGSVVSADRFGTEAACLVSNAGALRCWGAPPYFTELPSVESPSEVKVSNQSGCVKDASGLQCWGNPYIADVPALTSPALFEVGSHRACAVDEGQVICWDSSISRVHDTPLLDNPVAIDVYGSAGGSCADDAEGTHCWAQMTTTHGGLSALSSPVSVAAAENATCGVNGTELHCEGDVPSVHEVAAQLENPQQVGIGWGYLCASDDHGLRCWDEGDPVVLPESLGDSVGFELQGNHLCTTDEAGIECWQLGSQQETVRSLSPVLPGSMGVSQRGVCHLTDTGLACWGDRYFWPATFAASSDIAMAQPSVTAVGNGALCVGGEAGIECHARRPFFREPPEGITHVTDIVMGAHVICAIHGGEVSCWGSNHNGLVDVPPLVNPSALAMGYNHVCATDDTGVVCWGRIDQD